MHVELLDLVPPQILDATRAGWHTSISPTNLLLSKSATISRRSQQWLDFTEGLLENQFEPLK